MPFLGDLPMEASLCLLLCGWGASRGGEAYTRAPVYFPAPKGPTAACEECWHEAEAGHTGGRGGTSQATRRPQQGCPRTPETPGTNARLCKGRVSRPTRGGEPVLSCFLSFFFSSNDWDMKMWSWFRGQIAEFHSRYTEFLLIGNNPCKNVQWDEQRLKTSKKL